jgi:hypothetical protein
MSKTVPTVLEVNGMGTLKTDEPRYCSRKLPSLVTRLRNWAGVILEKLASDEKLKSRTVGACVNRLGSVTMISVSEAGLGLVRLCAPIVVLPKVAYTGMTASR